MRNNVENLFWQIPVTVCTSHSATFDIEGPREALFWMLNHWSATVRPEYEDAMAICYSALEQPAMLEHSRAAFCAAAVEASILH